MKKSNKTLWIVLGLIAVLVLWLWSGYNGMVGKQEVATTALADVQATYQRRADLIPNLVNTVQAYAKHEKSTFAEVAKARSAASQIKLSENASPQQLRQFEQAQGELTQALGKLMVVVERYPELKADQNFHSLQIQLEGTENRINEARQKYNEAVQQYNLSVRRFPNVLVAGMFGFDRMEKFQATAAAQQAPVVKFGDDI